MINTVTVIIITVITITVIAESVSHLQTNITNITAKMGGIIEQHKVYIGLFELLHESRFCSRS